MKKTIHMQLVFKNGRVVRDSITIPSNQYERSVKTLTEMQEGFSTGSTFQFGYTTYVCSEIASMCFVHKKSALPRIVR